MKKPQHKTFLEKPVDLVSMYWLPCYLVAVLLSKMLGQLHQQVDSLKSRLAQARAALRSHHDQGVDIMKRIDEVTDGLYDADGPEKNNSDCHPRRQPVKALTQTVKVLAQGVKVVLQLVRALAQGAKTL